MEQTNTTGNNKSGFSGLISDSAALLYKHPIITAALLCVFGMTVSSNTPSLLNSLLCAVFIIFLGVAAAVCSSRLYEGEQRLRTVIAITSAGIIAGAVFVSGSIIKGAYSTLIMNGGLALCAGIFFYLLACRKLSTKSVILLLFAAGFVMRLAYITMMTTGMIQHDVYSPGKGAGHAGYIEYIYENGHLPDFDVTTVDQFYHPPLHHIICAVWMRLQTMIGVEYYSAYENIQILTLFYSCLCLILAYKIFRKAGLSGAALIASTAVIAFCPTFYFLSGSINNDILSITFMLGAILNTLCWYRSRSMGRIICIALCIGLGMMTKLSAWMVAPAVALVFIYVFFTDLRNWLKNLLQYLIFIIVCAPIGLFWSVRNMLMWGIPFTYVQRLSENSAQYIGDISAFTRLFDLSPYQFADVAPQFMMYGNGYNEFNPLVGFFKTAAFDEGICARRFSLLPGFSHVLFFSSVILGLVGFVALIVMLIKKNDKMDRLTKAFFGMIYFVILIMYYYFCFDFPHVCTMNVRYGVPMIVIGAMSVGWLAGELLKRKNKAKWTAGIILCSVIGIYAVSGYMVYITCAESLLRF